MPRRSATSSSMTRARSPPTRIAEKTKSAPGTPPRRRRSAGRRPAGPARRPVRPPAARSCCRRSSSGSNSAISSNAAARKDRTPRMNAGIRTPPPPSIASFTAGRSCPQVRGRPVRRARPSRSPRQAPRRPGAAASRAAASGAAAGLSPSTSTSPTAPRTLTVRSSRPRCPPRRPRRPAHPGTGRRSARRRRRRPAPVRSRDADRTDPLGHRGPARPVGDDRAVGAPLHDQAPAPRRGPVDGGGASGPGQPQQLLGVRAGRRRPGARSSSPPGVAVDDVEADVQGDAGAKRPRLRYQRLRARPGVQVAPGRTVVPENLQEVPSVGARRPAGTAGGRRRSRGHRRSSGPR